MAELQNLVWFIILIPILTWIFAILNEKAEFQMFIWIISLLIWGISWNIFWTNNISSSLLIWWLIIWIIWFKRAFKIRF
jgi:hypothetical protein